MRDHSCRGLFRIQRQEPISSVSGRKTKTHCHMRLMNAHDGSRVTPGAFQSGITLRVAMSAMKVMKPP